jgi:hypothetical protein
MRGFRRYDDGSMVFSFFPVHACSIDIFVVLVNAAACCLAACV